MTYEQVMIFIFPFAFIVAVVTFKLSEGGGRSAKGRLKGDLLIRLSSSTFSFLAALNISIFIAYMLGIEFPANITKNLVDYPWGGSAHLVIAAAFFYIAKNGIPKKAASGE
jgi:hypothetical protein